MKTRLLLHTFGKWTICGLLLFAAQAWVCGTEPVSSPSPLDTPRDISHTRMKITATSARGDYAKPEKAIDGDSLTYWQSADGAIAKEPQALTLELDATYTVDALRYYLADNQSNPSWASRYRIQKYRIEISMDGKQYQEVARGTWDNASPDEQSVAFPPVQCRYVRLVCLKPTSGYVMASEICLESPKPPSPMGASIPPPPDAKARRAAFAERHSSTQLKLVADELYRFSNRKSPLLREFVARYQAGDTEGALRTFNRAFATRIGDMHLALNYPCYFSSQVKADDASLLMNNILTYSAKCYDAGAPGAIDWDNQQLLQDLRQASALSSRMFFPLLERYQRTGDELYLQKWGDYVEDFSMNCKGYSALDSFRIMDVDSQGHYRIRDILVGLIGIVKDRPGSIERLPATAIPRLLLKTVCEEIAIHDTYYKSNSQNWTPDSAPSLVRIGLVLDELLSFDVPLVETGLRRLEIDEVCAGMPDGTDVERMLGYNWNLVYAGIESLHVLDAAGAAAPISAERRQEIMNSIIKRLRFLTRGYTADAQYPLFLGPTSGGRLDYLGRHNVVPPSFCPIIDPLRTDSKTILGDRCIAPMLAMIGPDKIPGIRPIFNSTYLPWGGYRIIRENWDPAGQYAAMVCPSGPAIGAGDSNRLNLGLHAFGRDLLVDHCASAYDPIPSPVKVDGKDQAANLGYPRWGHKNWLLNGWEKPDPSRWLTSKHFDFMEGTYAGPYGAHREFTPEEIAAANSAAIRGVSHQRQVIFVREVGLWIVTDRLSSEKPHNYTWSWMLPCAAEKKGFFTFSPEDIVLSADSKSITTRKTGSVNLSMQSFSSVEVIAERRTLTGSGQKPQEFVCEIKQTVKKADNLLTVTAVLPRQTLADDFKDLRRNDSDSTEGFTTTLPNGANIIYQAARQSGAALNAGRLKGSGESLVMVEAAGRISGLVLNCDELRLDDRKLVLPAPDFAFEIEGQELVNVRPIYRAIEAVQIEPARNVFAGKETIRLSCPTPGVEIRYTLDGREPMVTSTLYTKPFVIQESTRLKARAFRPGLKEMEGDMDFTLATPVSLAVFEKQALLPATKAEGSMPEVRYSYYPEDWQKLYVCSHLGKPAASGTVPNVMDISPRKGTGTFTFIYDGFLDVPADGVYTFHAPSEFMRNNIDNGYDLMLEIDGVRWAPATRRHAWGNWSIALAKGKHPFRLKYLDYRGDKVTLAVSNWKGESRTINIDYTRKGPAPRNFPGMSGDYVWGGGVPELLVSGPGLDKQPIPAAWLAH